MQPLEELERLLRPAGGGVYLVSTGRAEQLALQRRLYGVDRDEDVADRFRATLARIGSARAVILGIPSDVGAGYQRGANLGPRAIRTALLDEGYAPGGLVDIGDVFVVPQLLQDEMLTEAQLVATRSALYPGVSEPLPVSPLSIAERALDLVFQLNPHVAPIVIGGDHSTAWPVVASLAKVRRDRWGIVQPDAHTDLLPHRLGVKICFATWSYHANELLGRGGRMVQVGTRATSQTREHWEKTLGVRQFWAKDCRARPSAVIDEIVAHLRGTGVTSVYFSNDIDGTDSAWADATGTPEPEGLDPEMVVELIRRLGRDVGMLGGDIMEVAPVLQPTPESSARTVRLAARYLRETIDAVLGAS